MSTADCGPVPFTAPLGGKALSQCITPPGMARRILPAFSPPGCHFYDSYLNCFRHRPEARAKLLDAARRHQAHRLATQHKDDSLVSHGCFQPNAQGHVTGSPCFTHTLTPCSIDGSAGPLIPCRCNLTATQLFATIHDVPEPALPLSKCELHEVLLSLPPRWQNYPWKLCFDTARDGFSLSTMYRCMEGIEEQQTLTKTVAFGLFFVHTCDDASFHSATTASTAVGVYQYAGEVAAAPATRAVAAAPTTEYTPLNTLPATTGASKSSLAAHECSSTRYGTARRTPPYGVIGCFTPEVPSLAHHAANIYFGSPETTVFCLDQLGLSTQRGEWMQRAFDAQNERHAAAVEGRNYEAGALHLREIYSSDTSTPAQLWNKTEGSLPDSRASDRRGARPASATATVNFSGGYGMLTSVQGFAQMADSADQMRVPVPMPTYVTIEHKSKVENTAAKNIAAVGAASTLGAVSPSTATSGEAASAETPSILRAASSNSAVATPTRVTVMAVSPHSSNPTSPAHSNGVRRALRVSPVKVVVPRAPLLSKYGWSGRPDNRKFIVCNPHFLALGAGKSGAALYVDEALQFGTSSNWCETYNAPCLFGPRPQQTPSAFPASPLSKGRQAPHPLTAAVASTTPGAPGGLPHREFSISRVVWFSIAEDKRAFRLMSASGTAISGCEEEDTRCRCGRAGKAGDLGAVDSSDLNTSASLSYMHRCDLLPFTEQPY